jgi:hypothetical protein
VVLLAPWAALAMAVHELLNVLVAMVARTEAKSGPILMTTQQPKTLPSRWRRVPSCYHPHLGQVIFRKKMSTEPMNQAAGAQDTPLNPKADLSSSRKESAVYLTETDWVGSSQQ